MFLIECNDWRLDLFLWLYILKSLNDLVKPTISLRLDLFDKVLSLRKIVFTFRQLALECILKINDALGSVLI
jgi:hypothetical protein